MIVVGYCWYDLPSLNSVKIRKNHIFPWLVGSDGKKRVHLEVVYNTSKMGSFPTVSYSQTAKKTDLFSRPHYGPYREFLPHISDLCVWGKAMVKYSALVNCVVSGSQCPRCSPCPAPNLLHLQLGLPLQLVVHLQPAVPQIFAGQGVCL